MTLPIQLIFLAKLKLRVLGILELNFHLSQRGLSKSKMVNLGAIYCFLNILID